MDYQEYLKTDAWKKLRRYAMDRADNRCQVCNSKYRLNVHHRVYPQVWGEELLVDLFVLCADCHHIFHKEGRFKIPLVMKSVMTDAQREAARGRYLMVDGKAVYDPPKPGKRCQTNIRNGLVK